MQHMVVVVPIDAQVDEAQHIAEEHRHQWRQSVDALAVRHLHLQHHDRDDDGDHTIAESLKPTFSHCFLVCPKEIPTWRTLLWLVACNGSGARRNITLC